VIDEAPVDELFAPPGNPSDGRAIMLPIETLSLDAVDTRDRVVTLKGSVSSADEKARAAEIVGKVEHVVRAEDRLTVLSLGRERARQRFAPSVG
jgi:hypothetical protein